MPLELPLSPLPCACVPRRRRPPGWCLLSKQNKPVDAVYSIIHHHYHVCTLRMACRSVQWRRRVVSSSFFSWYLYVSARISGYLMRSFLLLLLRNSSLHSKTTTSQVQGKILGSANIIDTPPPPCCGDYVTITLSSEWCDGLSLQLFPRAGMPNGSAYLDYGDGDGDSMYWSRSG